ncbi:hypothetical protein OROHE_004500 [Orobanche hederae]
MTHLLLRRLKCSKSLSQYLLSEIPNAVGFSSITASADSANESPLIAKPSSLSARMSFIFEQIDEIDKKREEKDVTLQRIRAWRESKKHQKDPSLEPEPAEELKAELVKSEVLLANSDVKKEVELVHPWSEWVELMERLVRQNYFDHRRTDEDGMIEGLGFDIREAATEDDKGLDFTWDFKTVQTAIINFGRDRFDILRIVMEEQAQIRKEIPDLREGILALSRASTPALLLLAIAVLKLGAAMWEASETELDKRPSDVCSTS